MKRILITGLALFTIMSACKKTNYADPIADVDYASSGNTAYLKINFLSAYKSNPSVQIKVNGERVSNLITSRTPFPGGGYNTGGGNYPDFLPVKRGSNDLSISIPNNGANTDSVILYSGVVNTPEGRNHYTVHITDTAAMVRAVTFEEATEAYDTSRPLFTFVNMMPNVPAIDLYYGSILVASNVAYLDRSTTFWVSPLAPQSTWAIRQSGSAPGSTALATYSSASTITKGKVYTAFASGYKGATDTRKPYISFMLIR